MKGIIMAGGEGTRLRPLTCDCPKPMIRLMDRPLLEYTIRLMKRHGIEDIAVTLGYQPDVVTDAFLGGEALGVRLKYYVETTPLGTAGGVRQARDMLDETFVVLSGDGVTDLNIARAAAFHREKGAMATLVLKHADDPLDYGVVDVDSAGRVCSFREKPDWSEVLSDTVNTGIYILEPEVLDRVPENRPCDFGREVFPAMVAEGLPVFGYVTGDYWCDVGDVRAYLAVHADAMEGRIRLEGLTAARVGTVRPGAEVDRAAVIEGPCLIEAGARICAGAHVGPYSVVSAGCVVSAQASLKRSILWPGAKLGEGAQARGCVLAAGAELGEGAQAYEECVLGAGAVAEARSVLLPGVKLWPGKRACEGERVDANRVWGHGRESGFRAGTLQAETPAEAARAAQAFVAAVKPREVLVGRADDPDSITQWYAVAAGCMAQGSQVVNAGACTPPLLRHALRSAKCDAALYVDGRGLTPMNALGARLNRSEQRAVALLNARQDYPRAARWAEGPVMEDGAAANAYVADVAALFEADAARAWPLALWSEDTLVRSLAGRALRRAGLTVRLDERHVCLGPEELSVVLENAGETCILSDSFGSLTDAQRQLMTAWIALEHGDRTLLLPDSATRGIEALLCRYDARAEYVAGEPARWMNALARRQPFQFQLHFDGLIWAVSALSLLVGQGLALDDWRQAMPRVYRRSRAVPMPPRQNGRVLHAFAQGQANARSGGGVRFERAGGWAWVGADEAHPRLNIVAEGDSAETAAELCDFCESELRRLSGERQVDE